MNQATEVYARTFDATFFGLPTAIRAQVEVKIGYKAGQNSGSAWETTESSTNSIWL